MLHPCNIVSFFILYIIFIGKINFDNPFNIDKEIQKHGIQKLKLRSSSTTKLEDQIDARYSIPLTICL